MKCKRIAALALSAVFAAGMLTGCSLEEWLAQFLGASSGSSSSSSSSSSSQSNNPVYDDDDEEEENTPSQGGEDDEEEDTGNTPEGGDEGEEDDPLPSVEYKPITTVEELKPALNANQNCQLQNDITISGNWDAISSYTGTFDGNGHTIKLEVDIKGGLFKSIAQGGTVKNLKLNLGQQSISCVNIAGISCAGGIAANNDGNILGCIVTTDTSTEDIKLSGGEPYGGGIAGFNTGTIQGCMVQNIKVGNSGYAGGIAGCNYNIIKGCAVKDIEVAGGTNGGIVGDNSGTLQGCAAANVFFHNSTISGGIAGMSYGAVISDCYWSCNSSYLEVEYGIGKPKGDTGTTKVADWKEGTALTNVNNHSGGYNFVADGGGVPTLELTPGTDVLSLYDIANQTDDSLVKLLFNSLPL